MLHPVRILALVALLPSAAFAYHFEDTLRGSTAGNPVGGSFGADGWTTTGRTDLIWYAAPTMVSGSIEFTITNLRFDPANPAAPGTTLSADDNELFAMYEAGYGISEPIRYSPEFRNNHYKGMLRVYGSNETGRPGQQKIIWGMCPSGAPGYDACTCNEFAEEPFGGSGTWDGTPQRIRIEWGGGHTHYFRNGGEVFSIDWSGSGLAFGPSELHFSLGTSRPAAVGTANMPVGITFSDLVVDGVTGAVSTCGGVPPPPPPPPPPGSCTGIAVGQDGTAASWLGGVFGDVSDLNVEADPAGQPTGLAYLKFPPLGGSANHAVLRLHTLNIPSAAGGSGQVCRVDSGAWDEASLTWSNKPVISSVCSGGARSVGVDQEVTWDVTALLTASGEQNLVIVSTDSNAAHYYSKESGGCGLGPELLAEIIPVEPDAGTPVVDAGTPPVVDAGTPGVDAGTPAADAGLPPKPNAADGGHPGGGGVSLPVTPGNAMEITGGCGCTSASGTLGLLSLASLGALGRRRRR